MKVAVKDACVLIDLANGGLLDAWFQLGIETHTTDLVVRQVKTDRHWQAVSVFIKAGLLKVASLTGEQVAQMQKDLGGLPVGVEDRTVLFLAMELDAILITGDRRLRIEGLRRKLEARGLLWILDEMVARQKLTQKLAAAKLRLIVSEGAFLPRDECEKRFRAWDGAP
jgi:hypothetical protein